MEIQIKHTTELGLEEKRVIYEFLKEIYGEYSEGDFSTCLGGLHIIAYENNEIVGHGALIQRQLVVNGKPLKAGYVESMAVRSDKQRQGIGKLLMLEINQLIKMTYQIGALSQSEEGEGLYLNSGWIKMKPPFYEFTINGIEKSDEISVMIYDLTNMLNVVSKLIIDCRIGDSW